MFRGSQRLVPGARKGVVTLVTIAVVTSFGVASAATLGVLDSSSLLSLDRNAAPPTTTLPPTTTTTAPTAIGCDNFTTGGPTGNNLDERPQQCGTGRWNADSGEWTIVGGGRVRTRHDDATATIAVGSSNVTVQATVENSNGANRAGGVSLSHNGDRREHLAAVIVGPGTLQIRLVRNTNFTVLASAAITPNQSQVVRFTRIGNNLTVRLNGTIRLTYTLTATQAAQATGTRAGLYQEEGTALRYANFFVTAPSP
jgi:hypothetical protein